VVFTRVVTEVRGPDLRKENDVALKPMRAGARVAVIGAVVLAAVAGGCATKKDREARRRGGIPLDRSVATGITPGAARGAAATQYRPAPYAVSPYASSFTAGQYGATPVVTTTPRFSPVDASDSAGAGPVIYASAPPVARPAAVQFPASAGAVAGGSHYTVAKGDTLFGIARARYGSGGQWQRIASANPGLTPETLKAGATIVVP